LSKDRAARGCLPEYKTKQNKKNNDQKIQDKITTNIKYSTKTRTHTNNNYKGNDKVSVWERDRIEWGTLFQRKIMLTKNENFA